MVVGEQLLVFVFVSVGDIHLADAGEGAGAIDFGEGADFESPVAGHAHDVGERTSHADFAGEGVPEAVEEREEFLLAESVL